MKIEIKYNFSGEVIFEYEKENNTIKDTVLEAIKRGINLRGADLRYTDLHGANLCGAKLYGADLYNANLHGADLRGANLYNANLHGADLSNAYLFNVDLYGVNLRYANLCSANLYDNMSNNVGKIEDWASFDNIGSRNSRTLFFKTDKGVFVQCGCFFGSLKGFVAKVKETHKGNKHERDYLTLVEFIKIKFEVSF